MTDVTWRRIGAILNFKTNLFVCLAKRHSVKHKAVDLLDRKQIVIPRIIHYAISDEYMPQHKLSHIQALYKFCGCRENNILKQLQITIISERQIGSKQGNLIRYRLKTVALTAHYLKYIRILLMRHNWRTGGKIVRERNETEVLAHPHAHVHCQMSERRCYRGNSHRHSTLRLTSGHLRGNDIVMQSLKTEQARGHLPVKRERRSISGSWAERILIGNIICSHKHLHIVSQWFGICSEP